ncbi:MAG: L,D-transpeptidase [Geitlerinemataceae cyanobacterium]
MAHTPPLVRGLSLAGIILAGGVAALDLLPERRSRPLPIALSAAPAPAPRQSLNLDPDVAWQRWFRHRLAAQSVAQLLHAQPPIEAWSDRAYLVVNLKLRRVYLFDRGLPVGSYRVGIGMADWETPTGSFEITQMLENPTWQHPISDLVISPGEANPLGDRWIGFWGDENAAIGFHGTNRLDTVGAAVSHGCLRMSNADVRELYDWVEVGMPVRVIAQ